MSRIVLLVLLLSVLCSQALDNGLARTPPMGWLSWERFRCNTDCVNDPENCIGEKLFMKMADLIASEGYKDVGYEYVDIDDCWLSHDRDADMKLQADPDRFPSGMKALADYVHGKGLKLGIYEDFGTHTCGGYPGSEYFLQMDAQTFADWQIDLLKFDGCYSVPSSYDDGYPPMAFFLKKTGRPIVLSCEYPLYQRGAGIKPNYPAVAQACNVARNNADVQDSWDSVMGIIEFYGGDEGNFTSVAGPGFWNDPDMLIIGNFGLSYDQQRVQMAMWCIMASPLIMSVDLRTIHPDSKALLQNKNAIAINQDPMGKQGRRISKNGNIQLWTKPILPEGSYAFSALNTGTGGTPSKVSVKLSDLGFKNPSGYNITEVFGGTAMGTFKPTDTFTCVVNPTGIFFGKAMALK